ncbi:unnamed protein product, partial [Brassica oleracea]
TVRNGDFIGFSRCIESISEQAYCGDKAHAFLGGIECEERWGAYGFVLWPYQQTTAYKLNALSQEWRQLCVKNMNIQSACTVLETRIDSLKREAAESTKLKTLVVGFQGMELRRENRECLTTSIAVRQPPSNPSTMSPLKF